jgi:hypothetical protein
MQKSTIDDILERLRLLETELENELDQMLKEKRAQFRYNLDKGKVRFEQGIRVLQKHQRIGLWKYLFGAHLGHLISAPVVYSIIVPMVMLDAMATVYQQTCFRIYGIPLVTRRKYVIVDHQHLAYLNVIEKINCIYCGYSNGVIEYVREIGSRTEQYWCPIKHAQRAPHTHHRVSRFLDYGDAENYKSRFKEIREGIKHLQEKHNPSHE